MHTTKISLRRCLVIIVLTLCYGSPLKKTFNYTAVYHPAPRVLRRNSRMTCDTKNDVSALPYKRMLFSMPRSTQGSRGVGGREVDKPR